MISILISLVVLLGCLFWMLSRVSQHVDFSTVFPLLQDNQNTDRDSAPGRSYPESYGADLFINVLNSLKAGIIVRDINGKTIYFNNAWRHYSKKQDDDLYSECTPEYHMFCLGDGVTPARLEDTPMYLALQGKEATNQFMHIEVDELTPVLVSAYPLRDKFNNQFGAIAVVQDYSATRVVELELERERELLNAIIKELPDAFIYRDMTGKAILVNDVMRRFRPNLDNTNFMEEIVTSDFVDLTGNPIPVGHSPIERALKGQAVVREEFRQVTPTTPPRDLLTTSIPVYDQNQQQYGAFAIMQDITALNKAAELRDRARRSQALNTLAAGLAHDFNNQLSAILGNAQLALADVNDPEGVRANLNVIVEVVRSSTEITRRLLTLGNTSGGEQQVLNVADVFLEIMPAIQAPFETYADLTVNEIDPQLHICCDKSQFESTLFNLLLNAKDATESIASPNVSVRTERLTHVQRKERDLDDGQEYVSITVEDNGVGFTSQSRQNAFEPFFSTKSSTGGAGLGLAIVDGFVQRNDGQVNILYSEPGCTRIEIVLPLVSKSSQQAPTTTKDARLVMGSGETVMVVEDRPELLDTICGMMSSLNYEVVRATNASDALRHVDNDGSIRLAIVDVMLGDGMNGVEMTSVAHETKPDLRVILTSGYAGNRRDITLPKHLPFLQKPFSLQVLSETVAKSISDTEHHH